MPDPEVSGRDVSPPPGTAEINRAYEGAYGDRFGTGVPGGPNSQLPVSGSPSQGCGTGEQQASNVGTAPPGTSPAGYDNVTVPGSTGMPNSGIMNIVNSAAGQTGCKFNITQHGGRSPRGKGTQNHPTGNATDGYLNCGGGGASIAQKQTFINNAVKNGATGIGTYDSGFIHVDNYHRNLAVWGDNGHGNTADGWAKQAAYGSARDDTAAAGNQATGPEGAPQGGPGSQCAQNGGGGGCAPSSTAAPQIAASLSQNMGLAMPSSLTGALSSLAGAALPGLSQAVSAAAGIASGLTGGLAQALGPAALAASGQLGSMITQGVAGQLAGMGSGILPGIVGNFANQFMSGGGIGGLTGMAQGLLSNSIQGLTGNLLNSVSPQLGQFMNMFNSASGAVGMANQLAQTLQTGLGQAFGNAGELFSNEGLSLNNLSELAGGLNLNQNPFLDIAFEPLNGQIKEAIDSTIDMVGNPADVLTNALEKGSLNAFGSMFYDWDGLASGGFSNFTNNMPAFAQDLMDLGRMADVKDVFRIGTPGQIAQQLMAHNLGFATGLGDFMAENNLRLSDLSNSTNDELVAGFLSSVDDPDVIEQVKENLNMNGDLNFDHLGDLLDPEKIFRRSYEYNYIENLQDMATQLSMYSGLQNINSIRELGKLIFSLEPTYDLDILNGEATPYNMADIVDFVDSNAPNGRFHPRGELTIADFMGTAAGYVHSKTLPRIAELIEDLYQNTEYFDEYYNLMDILKNTLNGDYFVEGTPATETEPEVPDQVVVPGIGTFESLDDAVVALIEAIEAELESARNAISEDEDAWELLNELESLHHESTTYILHEERLRKIYGIHIGPENKTEKFKSDGVTTEISLSDLVGDPAQVNVFISGIWQMQGENYEVDVEARTITLDSAPDAGTIIAVQYGTGRTNPSTNNGTVWQFANSLENYALETGLGGAADFLSRIVSEDVHGQRIAAHMRHARNKKRMRDFGLELPAWDEANNGAENYISYVTQTGIWTDDVDRAGEIFLQNTADVPDNYSYQAQKVLKQKHKIIDSVESSLRNVMRQLIFYANGNLAMSQLFVDLYQTENSETVRDYGRIDLVIPYTEDLPVDGYLLGYYKEILSEIMRAENLANTVFTQPLSDRSASYVEDLNLDIKQMIRLLQKILIVNGMAQVGLDEQDYRSIFGVPSVGKMILQNLSIDY